MSACVCTQVPEEAGETDSCEPPSMGALLGTELRSSDRVAQVLQH